MTRIDWPAIIERAAGIVRSYDTSVTLRQLFYRLVSAQVIPNTQGAYKRLSALTAEARRDGWFPDLIDRGRQIHRYRTFEDVSSSLDWLSRIYRVDRTEGQDVSLYLGVEKAGMVVQLQSWFGDLGVPVLALGGYSSQTYVDQVTDDAADQGGPPSSCTPGTSTRPARTSTATSPAAPAAGTRSSGWRCPPRRSASTSCPSIRARPATAAPQGSSSGTATHAGGAGRTRPGHAAVAVPGRDRRPLGLSAYEAAVQREATTCGGCSTSPEVPHDRRSAGPVRRARRPARADGMVPTGRAGRPVTWRVSATAARPRPPSATGSGTAIARPVARGGPAYAEIERKRWTVRGEQRTRETFGQPHPGDYLGRDGAA